MPFAPRIFTSVFCRTAPPCASHERSRDLQGAEVAPLAEQHTLLGHTRAVKTNQSERRASVQSYNLNLSFGPFPVYLLYG